MRMRAWFGSVRMVDSEQVLHAMATRYLGRLAKSLAKSTARLRGG